jgi:hypothetical protein
MSSKDLLPFSSTQVADAYYTAGDFDPRHSMFLYDGWTTTNNFAFRRRRLDPIGQPLQYGATAIFRLDRSAFLRGPMQLIYRRTGLTQPVGTVSDALYNCFVDFEGFASVAQVEVWHGQNKIQTVTGEDLYQDYVKNKDREEQIATAVLVHGNLPLGPLTNAGENRIDKAQSTQELVIDLRKLWFTASPRKYLLCTATSNEVEIRVTMRNLSEITQSTTTAYPTGSSIVFGQLQSLDVSVEPAEMNYLLAQVEQPTGINYKFNDVENQLNIPIQAGVLDHTIQLTSLRGACLSLEFTLRTNPRGNITTLNTTQSNLDLDGMPIRGKVAGTGTHLRNAAWFGHTDTAWNALAAINKPEYVGLDVYRTVDFHSITTSDLVLWDRTSDKISRYYIFPLYFRGTVGNSPIYCCPFAMVPGDSANCSGHKTWNGMTNPILRLEFASAPAYDLLVDVRSHIYQNVQHVRNEIFKTFQ